MGVKGLWRLLMPIGRRVSLETLTGKVIAVDASIWLTQFLKAMRNPETGQVQAAAHLIGFFRRLCRLHFYGIKPVFVFDGATPEIKQREIAQRRKRREQFATLGDAAVQRLARKLLQENLNKRKKMKASSDGAVKIVGNSAFAPGFNPGGDDRKDQQAGEENDGRHDSQDATKKQADEVAVEIDDSADQSVGDLLKEENESSDKDPSRTQQVSDWDKPIPVDSDVDDAANDEKVLSAEAKQDDESSVEYEDFGVTRDNDWTSKRTNNENLEFDVEVVSSLPADKRKDAIEDAKRRQRLRSRREFMPAAADPLNFSQVQLANFLRSSRLNQSIVTMATKAAEKENHGLKGEAMASDRTTRIEFIRETEADTRKHASPDNGLRRLTKSINAAEQDSSDDESWDDKRKQVGLVDDEVDEDRKPAARIARRRVIAIDDDSSNESESRSDAGRVEVGGGFFAPSRQDKISAGAETSRTTTAQLLLHSDSGDESDDGGGFLAPKDIASATSNYLARPGGYATTTKAFEDISDRETGGFLFTKDGDVPASLHKSDGSRTRGTGGGFIPSDEKSPVKTIADEQRKKGDFDAEIVALHNHENESDAVLAQELADRALAEAIQATEDAAIAEQSYAHVDSQYDSRSAYVGSHLEASQATLHVQRDMGSPRDDNGGGDDDDDDGNIDWEDGATSDVGQAAPVPATNESESDEFSRGRPSQLGRIAREQPLLSTEEASTSSGEPTAREGKEYWADDSYSPRRQSSRETLTAERAAALERAQATASNLADWAGRVFRRAMKEASEANIGDVIEEVGPVEKSESVPGRGIEKPSGENTGMNIVTVSHSVDNRLGERKVAEATVQQATHSILDSAQLQMEEREWISERNQRERDMDTVTDEMRDEAMRLLQLFGVPFLEAPAEAEAQCVALEDLGLVDGIVTDDSDVFVFGGKTVYKNIFDEKKYVEVYLSSDAEREMNLGRNHMVALAMLLGGDYTEGVKGVGIVNSMEVLEAFDVSNDLKEGLQSFKTWLDGFDPLEDSRAPGKDTSATQKQQKFHAKHRTARTTWTTPESFPSDRVINAYLHPVVDKSKTPFSWGIPDVENIVQFCRTNIGWRAEDTMSFLDPVIKQMTNGYRQTRIDSFMKYEDSIKFADVRSKRLREVLGLKEEGLLNKRKRK